MLTLYQANRSTHSKEINRQVQFLSEPLLHFIIEAEGVDCEGEVSLTFIDDEEMQEINLNYRQIDQSTDVLSFPMDDEPNDEGYRMFGDILISIPTAVKYAQKNEVETIEEIKSLMVHGMLHLLGYNDEEENEREAMLGRQHQILTDFNHSLKDLKSE